MQGFNEGLGLKWDVSSFGVFAYCRVLVECSGLSSPQFKHVHSRLSRYDVGSQKTSKASVLSSCWPSWGRNSLRNVKVDTPKQTSEQGARNPRPLHRFAASSDRMSLLH